MFRKLNPLEAEILNKLKKRNKVAKGLISPPDQLKVEYVRQDNMTIAVVQNKRKNLLGVSKFNPNDAKLGLQFDEEVGQRRALVRAFTNNA